MTYTTTSIINLKPTNVTFTDVQKAIIKANKAPPENKKFAWKQAFLLSKQYQIQENKK